MKRILEIFMIVPIIFLSVVTSYAADTQSDEFDVLREKWVEVLTGGDYPENGEVYTDYISPKVSEITASAQGYWNSMVKKENRVNGYADSYLWADALMGDTRDIYSRKSSRFSITYARLETMAAAYRTKGSALCGNSMLLEDIIDALDWMYAYKFNENTPRNNRDSSASNDNWYHWEISGPAHLNNIQALVYDALSKQQISNYQKAINKQVSEIGAGLTGANRLSVCLYFAVGGIVTKDSAKLGYARDSVYPALEYVTNDDGFYRDGSFIQHHTVPYNGAYGLTALENIADVMYLFENSSFMLRDENASNIYNWVEDSFLTTVYEGRAMDSVRGRAISGSQRPYGFIRALTKIASFAPADKADKYKGYIKKCYENNLSYDFYSDMGTIFAISKFYDIVNDDRIEAAGEPVFYKQFYGMDRFVHFRPGFSFNASMYSSRMRNYESINGENLKGWHTGSGMTYLYNADLTQYDDGFWATVDKYRLPGTTVVKKTDAAPDSFGDSFAGGTSVADKYGVSAMKYKSAKDSSGGIHSLTANKSWFMFDDEIVALGSGITSATAGDDTETIVENRKINSSGSNVLTIDGVKMPENFGTAKSVENASWAHIEGNPSLTGDGNSTDIGYYFPNTENISALRETRTDSYKSMSTSESSKKYTNNYLSLAVNHGILPESKSYAYVLLPGKNAGQVCSYSANPDIQIISESEDVHAVYEKNAGIFGAVFWNDKFASAGDITCSCKAAVMLMETEDSVELSVSDPLLS